MKTKESFYERWIRDKNVPDTVLVQEIHTGFVLYGPNRRYVRRLMRSLRRIDRKAGWKQKYEYIYLKGGKNNE